MMFFFCGASVGIAVSFFVFVIVAALPQVKLDEVDRETAETEAGRPLPWDG
jgi:hypothetical protein